MDGSGTATSTGISVTVRRLFAFVVSSLDFVVLYGGPGAPVEA
jgi:hypothetical protein